MGRDEPADRDHRTWSEYWEVLKGMSLLAIREPEVFRYIVMVFVFGPPLKLVKWVKNRV